MEILLNLGDPQAIHVKDVIGHFETILRNVCDSFQLISLIALISVQNSLCVHQKPNKNFIFSILPETPTKQRRLALNGSSFNLLTITKLTKIHIYLTVYFVEKAKEIVQRKQQNDFGKHCVFLTFNSCNIYDSNEIRNEKHSTQLIWLYM